MFGLNRRQIAITLTALLVGTAGVVGTVASAGSAHAAGTEVLGSGNQGTPNHTEFGIFSVGSGNSATGEFSAWEKGFPTPTTGWHWVSATITCSMISGNDAILTGTATVNGVTETIVAEAVDKTNPSGAPHKDALRLSFAPTITEVSPGCDTPSLPPVNLRNGDIRVGL